MEKGAEHQYTHAMAYSRRELVFCTPKGSPDTLLSSVEVNDKGTVSFDTKLVDSVTVQQKYSIKLNVANILNTGDQLHITWKNDEYDSNHGYFDDWKDWMYDGLTISLKSPNIALLRFSPENLLSDLLNAQCTGFMKTADGWLWNSNRYDIDKYQFVQNCLRTLNLPPITSTDANFDSFEIILTPSAANIYFTYSVANLPIQLHPNHELAILTEMPVQTEDIDRFIQGSRFKLNINTATPEIHQTVLMSTPFTAHLGKTFSLIIDQHENAAIHPVLNYKFDDFDQWDITPHDDAIIDSALCSLHIDTMLPKEYIVDKYEIQRLIDSKTNIDHCIESIISISNPDIDLELPNYKVSDWGTHLQLQLKTSCIAHLTNGTFHFPVHLRYVEPHQSGSNLNIQTPSSQLYWSCPVNKETSNAIFQSFYTDNSRIYNSASHPDSHTFHRHYYYTPSLPISNLSMVAGNTATAAAVDHSTLIIVLLATVFLLYKTTVSVRAT